MPTKRQQYALNGYFLTIYLWVFWLCGLAVNLFCTNKAILTEGIQKGVANAVLIKLNQIGTVTETLETIELAYKNSHNCFVSHRRGETVDSFISDLAVAVNAGHLKTGSGCRGERIEKFNQLIRIEHALGSASKFAGKKSFKNA